MPKHFNYRTSGLTDADYRYYRKEILEAEHLWEEQPPLNGHDIDHPIWTSPDWPPLSTYVLLINAYRWHDRRLDAYHARLTKIYCHRDD